jgi:surface carbohydrate biosynthesis protein
VFLAKSLRSISKLMLNVIHGLGHRIVAWDEESLVRYSSPEYYAWRYSDATFGVIDELFAWGEDDAEFFKAYSGYRGTPLHITGNPRIDLLRPEVRGYFAPEVERLRAQYGNFVLVNTNFSFVNNFVPSLNLIGRDAQGTATVSRTGLGMSVDFATRMANHQQAIYEAFRELMPKLAAWFPDRRIILRPHPSENHGVWRQVLADCPHVEVIHEGNVVPWLMAAKVLLHNGCTTAVEASVLGTPAVSYMPLQSEACDYHLPNGLSHCALTLEEVRQLIGEILDDRRGLVDEATRERLFSRHLTATRGVLACDRVMDVLVAGGYIEQQPPQPPLWPWLKARLVCGVRTFGKRMNSRRTDHRNSAAYHAHRFPDINAPALNARIARFSQQLGRFHGVRAEAHSPYVFKIRDPQKKTRPAGTEISRGGAHASQTA